MLMTPRLGGFGSPWREMQRLRREMNEILERTLPWRTSGIAPAYPAMNVWLADEGAFVTAELPGIDPNAIEISATDDTLTVRGNRPAEELPEGAVYHRRERGTGSFSRSITLPFSVDPNKVDAAYEHGVLAIRLPRAEHDKPRKITVKTA